jgi:hypothetical protein
MIRTEYVSHDSVRYGERRYFISDCFGIDNFTFIQSETMVYLQ